VRARAHLSSSRICDLDHGQSGAIRNSPHVPLPGRGVLFSTHNGRLTGGLARCQPWLADLRAHLFGFRIRRAHCRSHDVDLRLRFVDPVVRSQYCRAATALTRCGVRYRHVQPSDTAPRVSAQAAMMS
jgi:hypothetical protein